MKFTHVISIVAASVCVAGSALAASTGALYQRQYKASLSAVQVCATEGKIAGNSDKESTVNVEAAKCDGNAFRIQSAQEAAEVLRDRSNSL
ncbi:MAG: hypothetical protein IOD12_03050 [Silvanigrellales bacterium]|jgi:hypothetical protein|nr:hypothetical protein [Silvanigrellales bacterium]